MSRIIVHSIDIDGCLYANVRHTEGRVLSHQCLPEIIIKANESLLNFIAEESASYEHITLTVGSNRQDASVDFHCAHRHKTASAMAALPILQNYFSTKLKKVVHIDPLLLSDIYGINRMIGGNFNHILSAQRKINLPIQFSDFATISSIAQRTDGAASEPHGKIMLIYAQIHRAATLSPKNNITLNFYDDREDILSGLLSFYSINKKLVPRNITLQLYKYDGSTTPAPFKANNAANHVITGQGSIDYQYEWSIRFLAYIHLNQKPDLTISVRALNRYHQEKGYFSSHIKNIYIDPNKKISSLYFFRDSTKKTPLSETSFAATNNLIGDTPTAPIKKVTSKTKITKIDNFCSMKVFCLLVLVMLICYAPTLYAALNAQYSDPDTPESDTGTEDLATPSFRP